MTSCLIYSIAVVIYITFVTSSPINVTENPETCKQTTDDIFYSSFETWITNKINSKNDDTTRRIAELEQTIQINKQETALLSAKFQEIINANKQEMAQQISKIQEAMKVEKQQMELRLNQLQNVINSKDNELTNIKNSVSELRGQLSEFNNLGQQVNEFKGQITNDLNQKTQLINQQSASVQDVRNQLSQCITDIRVSAPETSVLWKGPGYGDEGNRGYFLTGVSNFNRDKYPDNTHRRMISFLRNNAWTPLHE